jgi:hypothetical protein
VAQSFLIRGASKLARLKEQGSTTEEIYIKIASAFTGETGECLGFEDVMVPEWNHFFEALSLVRASKHGYICLMIEKVQLGKVATDMLGTSLKAAPLKRLVLRCNVLGRDGMKFVIDTLKMNATLKLLVIDDNIIEHELDATSLAHAVNNHPTVNRFELMKCGLGIIM